MFNHVGILASSRFFNQNFSTEICFYFYVHLTFSGYNLPWPILRMKINSRISNTGRLQNTVKIFKILTWIVEAIWWLTCNKFLELTLIFISTSSANKFPIFPLNLIFPDFLWKKLTFLHKLRDRSLFSETKK